MLLAALRAFDRGSIRTSAHQLLKVCSAIVTGVFVDRHSPLIISSVQHYCAGLASNFLLLRLMPSYESQSFLRIGVKRFSRIGPCSFWGAHRVSEARRHGKAYGFH